MFMRFVQWANQPANQAANSGWIQTWQWGPAASASSASSNRHYWKIPVQFLGVRTLWPTRTRETTSQRRCSLSRRMALEGFWVQTVKRWVLPSETACISLIMKGKINDASSGCFVMNDGIGGVVDVRGGNCSPNKTMGKPREPLVDEVSMARTIYHITHSVLHDILAFHQPI